MATELTVYGRIVYGHPSKSRTKTDQKTKQPIIKDGQPVQQWAFGLAIDKATFVQQVWPYMDAEAKTLFPNGVPQGFSWKYKDGDTVDREGKPYSLREGYAGNYVLSIASELMAVPVFKKNAQGTYDQVPADGIKCGDWCAVGISLKANAPADRTHTPGIYVNPTAVELVWYDKEIVSIGAVDPNAVFKGAQYAQPPGASATPMAPGGGSVAPGMPGPAALPPQPGYQAPGAMPGISPAAPMVTPQRPTDATHIHAAGTPQEQWYINGAWTPAPAQAPLPPPASNFVPAPQMPPPAGMPGQMPPRV